MNNQQKADVVATAARKLKIAVDTSSADKLVLKLRLRDLIKSALQGTHAESSTESICDLYVPICEPFDAQQLLDLTEEWRESKYLPNRIMGVAITEQLGI